MKYTFFKNTILDNIDLSAYGIEATTIPEQITAIEKIFLSEYGHHNNRYKNKVELFASWLQGLPSVLTVPFMNYEILDNAKKAGYKIDTEKKEDIFLDNYFRNCAKAFYDLYNKLK